MSSRSRFQRDRLQQTLSLYFISIGQETTVYSIQRLHFTYQPEKYLPLKLERFCWGHKVERVYHCAVQVFQLVLSPRRESKSIKPIVADDIYLAH